jgi:hypothetical protein
MPGKESLLSALVRLAGPVPASPKTPGIGSYGSFLPASEYIEPQAGQGYI